MSEPDAKQTPLDPLFWMARANTAQAEVESLRAQLADWQRIAACYGSSSNEKAELLLVLAAEQGKPT